jgi:hypothetical protein
LEHFPELVCRLKAMLERFANGSSSSTITFLSAARRGCTYAAAFSAIATAIKASLKLVTVSPFLDALAHAERIVLSITSSGVIPSAAARAAIARVFWLREPLLLPAPARLPLRAMIPNA